MANPHKVSYELSRELTLFQLTMMGMMIGAIEPRKNLPNAMIDSVFTVGMIYVRISGQEKIFRHGDKPLVLVKMSRGIGSFTKRWF